MQPVPSVLIVDDNPADLELCRIAFSETGLFPYIIDATDGDEALQLFLDFESSRTAHPGRFPPTVVLLDINMPGMNGFEFLAEYEAIREDVIARGERPSDVIMLTSSIDDRDRERTSRFKSVSGYLTKPPSANDAIRIAEIYGAASS